VIYLPKNVVLRVENVWKLFGDVVALRDINMEVYKGELLVLLGPSGSGKSTLLRIIGGLEYPTRGRVYMEDEDITFLPPYKRDTSMVFQSLALFPHMTVYDNIAFGLRIRGYDDSYIHEKVRETADVMGIADLLHRKPTTLSGGEKQRVALARALVVEPKALLLDEPLSALDRVTRSDLQQFLRKLHSSMKFTAIHVTHDFLEASYLADRMAMIFDGRVVRIGTLEEIIAYPGDERIARFVGGDNIYHGKIVGIKGGLTRVKVGELELSSIYSGRGEALVMIRPEDVYVHSGVGSMSARNVFRGIVKDIEYRNPAYLVTFNVNGILLRSVVSKQALEELSIAKGKEFTLSVKAAAVRLISS